MVHRIVENFTHFYESRKINEIHFWDIDETLFNTFATIIVRDKSSGKEIRKLTNQEYNSHQLSDGEEYDFSEFSDSELFLNTSKVINDTIKIVKDKFKNPQTMIVFLTARGKFDDNKKLKDAFRKVGIKTNDNRIRFELSGQLNKGSTDQKKEYIIRKYISVFPGLKNAVIWDDHEPNIKLFDRLAPEYPNIRFKKYLIKNNKIIDKGVSS